MKKQLYFLRTLVTVLILILFYSFYTKLPNGTSLKDSLKITKARWVAKFDSNTDTKNEYQLSVSDESLATLEKCRINAIKKGSLMDNNQPTVDGILNINNSKYYVKVKLKGTLKSHWADPIRWSFRITIKNGYCLENGLKTFSIQSSDQRGHLVDQYYQHCLKNLGLINIKYSNIKFSFNGATLKNYALEDFFDAPLLAHNNKLQGPILKFNYNRYWENVDWLKANMEEIMTVYNSTYAKAPIKSFKFKSKKNKNWKKDSKEAIQKLENFRNGILKTSDVFDINAMGKYFALNTLFGNQHPSYLTNLRFYYNPISKLIEPIGYDIERIHLLTEAKEGTENFWPNKVKSPQFIVQLFSDSLMASSYHKNLEAISKKENLFSLETTFSKDYKELKKSNPAINNNISTLAANRKTIEEILND